MFEQPRSTDDFAAEIHAHIALETEHLMAEGMNAEDAYAMARRRFGNALTAQERFYESRRRLWLDQLLADLRQGWRGLARYPLSGLVAVVSLAAGIGSTAVALVVRHAVFDSPPPLYADPHRLSMVGIGAAERAPAPVPAALFRLWHEDARLEPGLAAARAARMTDVRLPDRFEAVTVRPVSANLFTILGVPAALGRTFDPPTSDSAEPAPVVLSHRAWRNLFEGRADVVGSIVWIDAVPHAVVGVMPERFWFLAMGAPLWIPLDPRVLTPTETVRVVARREPGVTELELSERLQRSVSAFEQSLPIDQRRIRVAVSGIEGTPLGQAVGPMVPVLLATSVLLTLLIACTNVAMLMIAQWTGRAHEIAIRASLGASRWRIIRSLVAESALIALAGGALGTGVTLALRGVLGRGGEAVLFDLSIPFATLATTAAVTVTVGLVTGLVPAWYETRWLHRNPLGRLHRSDRSRQRWRHALVVFEIAVTVALLVVTGALVSASQRMLSAQPGFDTYPIAVVRLDNIDHLSLPAVLERLGRLPGVVSVAAASNVPIIAPPPSQPIALDRSGASRLTAERVVVSPGFFETLGVARRAGRDFSEQDDARGPRVALVNDVLAERLWPKRSPIGEFMWSSNVAHQVVGVVAGYQQTALRPPRPSFFLPVAQAGRGPALQLMVRASGDPAALIAALRQGVRAAAPPEVVTSATTLDAILDIGSRELLVGTYPMLPLIATALLLTTAGIYSVLAFAVTRRSTELAIRVAVGASRRDVCRLVAAQSVRLVAIGLAIGVAVTFAVTRLAQGTGSVFDSPGWQAFLVPIAIVVAIGVAATLVPVRRAVGIQPATLLRSA